MEIDAAFTFEEDFEEGSESTVQSLVMEEVLSLVGEESESQQNSTEPQIINIVHYFSVGCNLDLKDIARRAWNVEYNPKKFTAVIMRIKQPKTTALIFHEGKVIVTGAKNEDDTNLACRKYIRMLQKLGYPAQFLDSRVTNMVALAQMPFLIDLIMLNAGHYACTRWEPEIFPGLYYTIPDPRTTLLIFQSGKVIFLGFTDRKDLQRAFDLIYPVLDQCKKILNEQFRSI